MSSEDQGMLFDVAPASRRWAPPRTNAHPMRFPFEHPLRCPFAWFERERRDSRFEVMIFDAQGEATTARPEALAPMVDIPEGVDSLSALNRHLLAHPGQYEGVYIPARVHHPGAPAPGLVIGVGAFTLEDLNGWPTAFKALTSAPHGRWQGYAPNLYGIGFNDMRADMVNPLEGF